MDFRLRPAAIGLLSAAALFVAACDVSSPSTPSVSFGAPTGQVPATGTAYNFTAQPIVLTIANVTRTGSATVTYDVDLSLSDAFGSFVFQQSGIAEGAGVTTVALPALEGGKTYFWRSRGVIDDVPGGFSATASFFVRPNIEFAAPDLLSPGDGSPVFSERPTFVVRNASRTGDPGAVVYEFQVAESASFASLLASASIGEQQGETSWSPSVDLPLGNLFWRARAADPTTGALGPFSSARGFDRRPSTGDQLDLSTVTIVQGSGNIASWPATARVTSAFIGPGLVCVDHTHLGAWPQTIFFDTPGEFVQGNQWMFAFIGGKWYGGSGRWFRPGQACKGTEGDEFTGTFYQDGNEPLRNYAPRIGDTIGLMSSTPNRFYPSMRTVDERSNVVLVRYGG